MSTVDNSRAGFDRGYAELREIGMGEPQWIAAPLAGDLNAGREAGR